MNKSEIKIIFVDVDWTLLNHFIHEYDDVSCDGLRQAQKSGVLVYVCTARPYDSLKCTGFFNHFIPDGIISTNGAVAHKGDELLYSMNFPHDVVKQVEKVCGKHHIVCEMCTEKDRFFNIKPNKYFYEYIKDYQETVPKIKKVKDENVSAILILAPEKLDETLKKECSSALSFYRFHSAGIDTKYYVVHKGIGVTKTLKMLGLSKENALAIGDDYGDIDMFQAVKYSAAMGNGRDEVKQSATYEAKHINENGVLDALKYFHII